MSLNRMALTNYRCFAQRVDVELRPITVILGRNNAGKSALVRAPVVCNTGIRTDSPAPLDLDLLNEDMLESFTDLIYSGRPHGSIEIELGFDTPDASLRLAATVQNIDEYQTQVVSHLEFRLDDHDMSLNWEPTDPPENARYTFYDNDSVLHGAPIAFQGLVPAAISRQQLPGDQLSHLAKAAEEVRSNYPTIRYFGPFRDRPARRYKIPARMPTVMGASGENAAAMLIIDAAREQGGLVSQLNQILASDLPGWSVDVADWAGMYAIMLRSNEDDAITVNFADVGTGVAQVLPLFVQRAADILHPPVRPVLEIVEQPELHLHPAAHGALADLYIATAARGSVRFLIESHSETGAYF